MRTMEDQGNYSPDGLNEASIDALISDVEDELAELPFVATSALLDGTARTQRDRRIVKRTLGGTVTVLRLHSAAVPSGTEAA
ncbi:hypothetical protein [Lentzea aerocolonigenes]|uniref:hypothetical protein n=1 Tax=Lentzea aerocolonigenes TaxID=68170 RepID=UPI0004C45908|nr:hypothetical protein [Lentzea aerocolonigenes]MCP2247730.1 hypothetical protein [Lentzea aerocolonigenes]